MENPSEAKVKDIIQALAKADPEAYIRFDVWDEKQESYGNEYKYLNGIEYDLIDKNANVIINVG